MFGPTLADALGLAATNLLSIPVLAFALGLVAARIKGDLRLPQSAYETISIILLLAIGLKGGVTLTQTPPGDLVLPVTGTLVLGVTIPVMAFAALRWLTPIGRLDRGVIAAHYGSTSLVTFTAALVLLESSAIPVEGFMTALLTIMEIPGIVVGLLLASSPRQRGAGRPWLRGLVEVLTSRSVLLLVGGLAIGAVAGASSYARVEPLFSGLFQGLLVLFLLHLGTVVGRGLADIKRAGWGLVVFAIAFPLFAGLLGATLGALLQLSIGGATMLAVLAASASYIAAPAAVRIALPEANEALALTASLAVTFPFNLAIGIPTYLAFAEFATQILP